jgi:hypothetical protein
MKGVDNVGRASSAPKWDQASPTKYAYDPKNYDPADYAKFKAARLAADPIDKNAKNPFGKKGTIAQKFNAEFSKARTQAIVDKHLQEFRDKGKKHPSRAEIDTAARSGKTLTADVPSTCLASLSWHKGVATAEFYRGGEIVYDYPMSLEEFLDWSSDSLGEYGNDFVF